MEDHEIIDSVIGDLPAYEQSDERGELSMEPYIDGEWLNKKAVEAAVLVAFKKAASDLDAAVLAERERWARDALDNYDEFLSGGGISLAAHEVNKALSDAASFAAAAYEKGYGGQAVHALLRSFLIALIDPSDERLDYLRADPKAGVAARKARGDIEAIRARTDPT